MLNANYMHFNKQKIFPCFIVVKFLLLLTQDKNSVTDFLVSSWYIQNITIIFLNEFYIIIATISTPLLIRLWMNLQKINKTGALVQVDTV